MNAQANAQAAQFDNLTVPEAKPATAQTRKAPTNVFAQ